MTRRALVVVTHLLGAGHLTRAAALARALARAGVEATLVSGGAPARLVSLTGVRVVQLPPVRVEGTAFSRLLDEAGRPVTPAHLAARRALLLATLREVRPDAVVTELFPFGRRVLAHEFLDLVHAARALEPRPAIVASVRDVLAAPSRPERVAEAHGRLGALYDAVLVHGDPALVPLDASWPGAPEIAPLLRYTGYVDDGPAVEPGAGEGTGEVLVSGGSSAAGAGLYRAALGAARLRPDRRWRVLAGGGLGEGDLAGLRREAPGNLVVERARPDFRSLLARAALSVSQAGYNTAVDLLRTGAPAVLVPFEAGGETEQRLRAERFDARGWAELLPEAVLTPESLAAAVDRAPAAHHPRAPRPVRLDGADEAARIVLGLIEARPAPAAPAVLPPRLDWRPLDEALRRIEGARARVWWRDDDATAHTPALDRLLALARRCGTPLALAAIPARIEPSLAQRLAGEPAVAVLVHGLAHANHAPAGEKRAELGAHRPLAVLADDAAAGLEAARGALGALLLPVLVPPWNRAAPGLGPLLPALGYRGLSAFGPRPAALAAPGLAWVNAHVDPVDWRGGRGLACPDALVARAAEAVARSGSQAEPVGLLTHHLVHDEAVWAFAEALLERLAASPATEHPFVGQLFSDPDPADSAERT